MQERGLASYVAEFLGTLMLVLFICLAVCLFVPAAQPGPAEPVHRLERDRPRARVRALPADPDARRGLGSPLQPGGDGGDGHAAPDQAGRAGIYIVAQLAGALAGALIVKLLLDDFANADLVNYGAVGISERLDGKVGLGMLAEFIGTFALVFAIMGVAVDPRTDRALGPLAIGAALGVGVMVIGPLTGAGFNPARAFGPALVSGE